MVSQKLQSIRAILIKDPICVLSLSSFAISRPIITEQFSIISLCPGQEVHGEGGVQGQKGDKKKGENKIQQNLSNQQGFSRVSLCKETLACNLATATTTEVLVAHIPDKQRNV